MKAQDDDTWIWQSRPGKGKSAPIPSWVELRGDRLTLRAMTSEQAEAASQRPVRLAGDAVTVGLSAHTSLPALMRQMGRQDAEEGARQAPGDLPIEKLHELARDKMDEHYQRWIDEPVPALDNATPRVARVGEDDGR